MFVTPDPDEFFDSVFFIDPLTKTVDDSLVMALLKDPQNADRYSKFLQVRSSFSSPRVDDETNFELCMPRSVQSLSEHQAFSDKLSSFIRSFMPLDNPEVHSPEVSTSEPPVSSGSQPSSSNNS